MAYQGESGLISLSTSILLIALIALVYHRFPTASSTPVDGDTFSNKLGLSSSSPPPQPSRRNPVRLLYHVILLVLAVVVMVLVPTRYAKYVFTDLAVTAVGTVFPIYESIRAVCTPEEDDDKVWLQYWLVGGLLFLCTGWIDNNVALGNSNNNNNNNNNLSLTIVWYEIACFFFLWLYLPQTNGATLIYEHWTGPIITPLVQPLATKLSHWLLYAYQTLVNGVHLWLVWFIFALLPVPGLKRIIAIAIGTIYPWLASTVAAATDQVDDDTTWLTYWSCYGLLFLFMDVIEAWLYWVPGFYSLVIFATVYLMLPMFQGADKVFRNILVPLAGLQELLLLRDAIQVKKMMLKTLAPDRAVVVRRAIAKFFNDDDTNDHHKNDQHHGNGNNNNSSNSGLDNLKSEFQSSWRRISTRNLVTYNAAVGGGGADGQGSWDRMV